MVQIDKPFNLQDYLAIGLRRKWYIIIPLIFSIIVSFGVYKYLPRVYKAMTLILVQPQRVPETYVRSTITDTMVSRLNTISQEILSRTRLEKVIHEFNLFSEIRNNVPMEGIIEMMRNAIAVKVQNMEEQLKRKEHDIRNFKERSMGQLPQQLDANLRVLERLQDQLKTTSENMRAAEDRTVLLQNQIEQLKARAQFSAPRSRGDQLTGVEDTRGQIPEDPLITQLNNLKRDLSTAQSKYTDTHPDVMDLKRKIANLEPKVKELLEKQEAE